MSPLILGPTPYLVKHFAAPCSRCGRNRRGKDISFFFTSLHGEKNIAAAEVRSAIMGILPMGV